MGNIDTRSPRAVCPAVRAWAAAAFALMVGCQPSETAIPIHPAEAEVHAVEPSPIEILRDRLTQSYRLAPDRRFLIACSVVHAVLAAKPRTDTVADLEGGVWHVKHDGKEIGQLPEFPTYDDGLRLLVKWSTDLLKSYPLAGTGTGTGGPSTSSWRILSVDDALSTLEKTQQAWAHGERTRASIGIAAGAFVSLQAQTFDRMGMADEIDSRALAMVAILKASGGSADAQAAMLATGLGYAGAAKALASPLDPRDLARTFVLHEDSELRALAEGPAANDATRALFLRRLGARFLRSSAAAWIHDQLAGAAYTLPVVFARLVQPDLVTERAISFSMPGLVLLATLRRAGDPRAESAARDLAAWTDPNAFAKAGETIRRDLQVEDATLLDVFESELAKIGAGLTGPLFDAETEQTYFRAAMYAGLSQGVTHAVYGWSALEPAKAFVARWGTAGGEPAADLRVWAQELIDAQWGHRSASELLSTMQELPSFGAAAQIYLYEALFDKADWGDARVFAGTKALVARMDTRLEDRRELFNVAYSGLHDLVLCERIGRTLLAESPPYMTDSETTAAWMLRDAAWFKAQLNDADITPYRAVTTACRLQDMDALSDADARTTIRQWLNQSPDDWPARRAYDAYLEKKSAWDEEKQVASDWLTRNPHAPGIDPLEATTTVARALYLQGRYAEGWKVIEPLRHSEFGGAMQRGAWLLYALGRTDEAEELARERLERYPFIESVADLAELYWRDGKNDEAAALFAPQRVPASLQQIRWVIGPAFVRAFEKRQQADAIAAFQAMSDAGPRLLHQIANSVEQSGAHELAFKLLEPIRVPGMENLEFLMSGYLSLEKASGEAAAISWLKPRVPPPFLEPLSQFAFGAGADDLLWEVVPSPAPDRTDDDADDVWQFRAAAVARGSSAARRRELSAHYDRPLGGRYDVLGRYLLGTVDERTVFMTANKPHDACEIAYWLGYRAQLDGRYAEASQWYRMAVESGLTMVWEYRQAYDRLYAWYAGAKALSLLPNAR